MNKHRKTKKQGMALVCTMMVLLVILSVILVGNIGSLNTNHSGALTIATNSLGASNMRINSVSAFNMAQSGINVTVYWLSSLASPPTNNSAFAPALPGYTTVSSPIRSKIVPDPSTPSNYFSVEIYPDVSNPTNTQKKYLIESVGTCGTNTQIIRAYVEQTSLSKYEVLLNKWFPNNNYWVQGLSSFDGPVHDNNSDGQQENTLWLSNPQGASPLFTYTGNDAYTVSSAGVNWYKDNYWTSGTPTTSSDWASVATGGAATVHTGQPSVPFPTASTQQMNAALGSASAPATTGVLIPSAGGATNAGVYIHGDVNTMQLSIGSPDKTQQIITITQTDSSNNTRKSVIQITPSINQTSLQVTTTPPSGTPTVNPTITYTGTTNGVIYCDGNIGKQGSPLSGGLYGVVADNVVSNGTITHQNSLTIATSASTNLNIAGNVTYNTQRQKVNGVYIPEGQDSNFTQNAGVLGIISNNIMLDTKDYNGNALNNFEFDGCEFAYTLCDADQWSSRPVGTWENMGSYISNVVGVFGQFDGSNTLVTGFNTQFNYDQRLRDTPPPYFPTTGNQYDIVSWQQVNTTIQ